MPVLVDSFVPLEQIWKSFSEFAGVVKPSTAEVLGELLLLWTITTLSICDNHPISSLESHCIGFLSFPLSLVADLVSYSVNLLILLETPKSASNSILTLSVD